MKVWSEMCHVLENAVERYEEQVRVSQTFHTKFLRLNSLSETKLESLSESRKELQRELHALKQELNTKISDISALSREVRCAGRLVARHCHTTSCSPPLLQVEMWKSEAGKLTKRMADEMHARLHGDSFGSFRSTDVYVRSRWGFVAMASGADARIVVCRPQTVQLAGHGRRQAGGRAREATAAH